jgi:hypothetical protein
VASTHGKEAIIALLGAGDFLGEGCIASDQPVRIATATAVTKCSVLRIENREMLRNAFDADPAWEGRRGGGSDPRHKSAALAEMIHFTCNLQLVLRPNT